MTSLVDANWQKMMLNRNPEFQFSGLFQDMMPFVGMDPSHLRPDELSDPNRVQIIAKGKAKVFDTWIPMDLEEIGLIFDNAAKGVWKIMHHLPNWAPYQGDDRGPRLFVYMAWIEYHRIVLPEGQTKDNSMPLHSGATP